MKVFEPDSLPNPVIVYDAEWKVSLINQAALTAMGFKARAEITGKDIFSVFNQSEHQKIAGIQKKINENKPELPADIFLHKGKNGKTIRFSSQFKKIPDPATGNVIYIESGQVLQQNHDCLHKNDQYSQYFSILSENVPGLEVFLIDKSFHILCRMGKEAHKQGWDQNPGTSNDFLSVFPHEVNRILEPLLHIGFETTPVSREFSSNHNHYSVRVIPLLKKETEPLCVLILQNTTETKLVENKLKHSVSQAQEANKAKDHFVAKMSHEIRTPLNAISGFTEQLEQTRLTKKQSDYTSIISNASRHLLSIVDDILVLSKIESGQIDHDLTPFSVDKVLKEIDDVLNIRYKAKNLDFKIIFDLPGDELLLGEPSKLRQVLINLANNAIKFTRKGSILIKCCLIGNTQTQQTIKFEVTDTGVGIDADEIKNIFKPFHQVDFSIGRKYAGCGLGLTISKELVESMGGKIDVESTPGEGSTFRFTLRLNKAGKSDKKNYGKEHHQADLSLKQLRILFVDDDPVNLLLGRIILNKFGVKADFSKSGSDALNKYRKGKYDIVFLDINMPYISGLEVTKIIRDKEKDLKEDQKTRIIAMTANALKKHIETYMQAGIDSVILKPYQEETLYQRIVAYALKTNGKSNLVDTRPKPEKLTGIDLGHLLKFTKGDTDFTLTMLDTFLDSARHSLKKIKSAYRLNDYNTIAEVSHKLIPSVEQLGIKNASGLLKRIERRYLRRKNYRKDPQLIESAIHELQNGIKSIKRYKSKIEDSNR